MFHNVEALCPCESYIFECSFDYEKPGINGPGVFDVRLKDPMDSMCPYCTFQVTPEFLDNAAEEWLEDMSTPPDEDWLDGMNVRFEGDENEL